MSIERPFWSKKVVEAWKHTSIVWLQGVRRVGKTTLAKSFEKTRYINCDLPSVHEELKNPEVFLKENRAEIIILDEIHQLEEASNLLKIAADEFSSTRILATGSSMLVAGNKFKDTLTGRKRSVHFLPVLVQELPDFKVDLGRRILQGGLPPALLSEKLDKDFYAEWLDSFYARDIQELFAVEKRQPFLKALEYLLIANGQLFEVTKLAQAAGVSRPTTTKYLEILELTNAISLVRPFFTNPEQEIVSQPKVYGFDTGFCCYAQGVKSLSSQIMGYYLENLTLETMQAYGYSKEIRFWRTKSKIEIDFILSLSQTENIAIECKWKEKNFDEKAIEIFRARYPKGRNWVITSDSITRNDKGLRFINIRDFHNELKNLK